MQLARDMIAGGVRAKLTCVDPRKLDASFAGREFDAALLEDLPEGVDPCGENGEFHTFVYDGPAFREPLSVQVGAVVERDGFVFADVMEVEVEVDAATEAAIERGIRAGEEDRVVSSEEVGRIFKM